MIIARRWVAWLIMCAAAPVLAQGEAPRTAAAPATPGQDIVVNGVDEAKSDWRRAETDHVILFGQGSESELKRVTRNLELLHHLMSRLYRRGDTSDDALKLKVTLIESQSRFRAMGLRDLRSQEGPFAPSFSSQRYYDPQDGGEMLAVAHTDQTIELNTARRFNEDCDDYQSEGGTDLCGSNVPDHHPVVRSWEAVLYATFAQHFMLTYAPAAYPRWYLDGIGALFSTIDVQRNGAMDYARPPVGFNDIFKSYGYPNFSDILSGRYLDQPQGTPGWSPYAAWLIAHYFLFSNPRPERREQFRRYMTAVGQGLPLAEAAKAFDDTGRLQRDLVTYADRDIAFAHAEAPQGPVPDPLIATLSITAGALIEAKLSLESQLADAAPGAAASTKDADWLARLRGRVTALSDNEDALLFEAEAECRGGRATECLAIAERILSRSPDHAGALAWKGVALTDQAVSGPLPERAGRLAAARAAIGRAIGIDNQAPLALIAYFQSFTKAGERVPDDAMRAMAAVIRSIPAAPGPRLYLAQELMRQGQPDVARRVLQPVLHGAYDTPEKKAAERLFSQAPGSVTAG